MGCGCGKQNNQDNSKIVPQGIKPIVVQAVSTTEPLNYTIEDIIRIKDYLSSTNKHDSEKQFISFILNVNFGDVIPGYCDQNCLKHIRKRVKEMEAKLKTD
jgi:hypothetical protein